MLKLPSSVPCAKLHRSPNVPPGMPQNVAVPVTHRAAVNRPLSA